MLFSRIGKIAPIFLILLVLSGCVSEERQSNVQESTVPESGSPTATPSETALPAQPPKPTATITPSPEKLIQNEQSQINKTTSEDTNIEKFDLSFGHIIYNESERKVYLYIKKDRPAKCPKFTNMLYINDKLVDSSFDGFNSKNDLEAVIKSPPLKPGIYEITLIIDSENDIKETDEENNQIFLTVSIE